MEITNDLLKRVAEYAGCAEATVYAVAQVAAVSEPLLSDNRPPVVFDGGEFSRLTHGVYDDVEPSLSHRKWSRKNFVTGRNQEVRNATEWQRLSRAMSLDSEAALKSARWGAFQIPGANHRACGFENVRAFTWAMQQGADAQVEALFKMLCAQGLDLALANRDWPFLSRAYVGPDYRKDGFHVRLAKAYSNAIERGYV